MIKMNQLKHEFESSNFWNFIGFQFISANNGEAEISFRHRNEFENVMGTLHGGIYMAALDTVMGLTSRTLGYKKVVTIQMETKFLRSVIKGKFKAIGKVIHQNKSTVLIEGKLIDEGGVLISYCIGTFKVMHK